MMLLGDYDDMRKKSVEGKGRAVPYSEGFKKLDVVGKGREDLLQG